MNKTYMRPKLLITIFIMAQLCLAVMANGQNLISADPADTFDPEGLFINPGIIPFQHRQVTLGMKVYQLGFLKSQDWGLHTSYFSLSLPKNFWGFINLGLTGQNFSVPLYDQTNFSLALASRPIERLSIGIKYNLFTKSYHQKYFDLVYPDDPVFASGTVKFAQSLGVGFMLFPWSTFSIGFSGDHLNRPDISLFHDNYRQPLVYDFGLRYSWRYFSSSIYFNRLQQHWQFNWLVESRPFASSLVKLGFVQRAAKISAQVNIIPGLALNYAFDYPLYEINQLSNGSHQFSVIYDLDYRDKIKELLFTRFDDAKFPIFNLQSQFFVEIETDKLEIISQKINRTVEAEIPNSALKSLTEVELALHDSALSWLDLYEHGYTLSQNFGSLISSAKYSQKYKGWLADNLLSKKIDSLRFITDPNSMQRAISLRNFLVDHAPFLDQQLEIKPMTHEALTKEIEPEILHRLTEQQNYILNPESVAFQISALKMQKYRGTWKLVISDYADHEIKAFVINGHVPDTIPWDWRDNDGNLIKPDVYYYYIQWKNKTGQWQKTQPRMFSVAKISRTLTIDIRSTPESSNELGRIVEIKIVN
jgi:hypothetical protein